MAIFRQTLILLGKAIMNKKEIKISKNTNDEVTHVSSDFIDSTTGQLKNGYICKLTGKIIEVDEETAKYMVKLGEFRDDEFDPYTVQVYLHKLKEQDGIINQSAIMIGEILNDAEKHLDKMGYKRLIKSYGRTDRTIARFKMVAGSALIKKYRDKLPESYSTLAIIHQMDEKKLKECIDAGVIDPSTHRSAVEKIVKDIAPVVKKISNPIVNAINVKMVTNISEKKLDKIKEYLKEVEKILGKDGEIDDLITRKRDVIASRAMTVQRKELMPVVREAFNKQLKALKSRAEHKPVANFYKKYGKMADLRAMCVNDLFEHLGSDIRYSCFEGYTIQNKKVK